MLTNVSLHSITGLARKSVSKLADHFLKLMSKTADSKFYLQSNYILQKLSYQLLCCCIKEQYKSLQSYCIHCYVKKKKKNHFSNIINFIHYLKKEHRLVKTKFLLVRHMGIILTNTLFISQFSLFSFPKRMSKIFIEKWGDTWWHLSACLY